MINIKISRQAEYRSFKDKPGKCPGCGSSDLVNEYQSYVVATRRGKKIADSFVMGGDFGWFCESCPTVVINRDAVGEMLGFGKRGWNIGSEYIVLGIVDLDAIPAKKRHLPLGDPNNPLPLIEFTDVSRRKKNRLHSENSLATKETPEFPAPAIDDPKQVETLLERMEEHLPIPAEVRRSTANYLRTQGSFIPPHRQVLISNVFYSGDEGGVMCGISPEESKEAVVISLTQLKIPYHHPLEKEIRAYQKARIKKLR